MVIGEESKKTGQFRLKVKKLEDKAKEVDDLAKRDKFKEKKFKAGCREL